MAGSARRGRRPRARRSCRAGRSPASRAGSAPSASPRRRPRARRRRAPRRRSRGPRARRAAAPVRKSIDGARACAARPSCARAAACSSDEARGRDDDRDDRDLADVDAARSSPAGSAARATPRSCPSGPNAEQRDALQQERDCEGRDEHHGGRLRAQRPEHEPVHRAARARARPRSRRRSTPRRGQVPLRREGERVRTRHDQLAVREVDEAEDAEDETDADRHQRVDRRRARVASASVCQSMFEDRERHAR